MTATKDDLIIGAFDELRISGLTVSATPKEKTQALTKMEEMAAEYESRNICINYLFEDEPDPASSSGIGLQFNQMMKTNLAVRLIPTFGKNSQTSPALMDLKGQASASLSNASARTAVVNKVNYPDRQALGSGNSFRWGQRWRRFYKSSPNAPISCSTEQMQLNTTDRFIASWANFLGEDETITSFTIKASSGLTILTSQIQNDSTEVFYRVKTILCGFQTVTISIVTSITTPEYADVRTVNFDVINNLSV
jgi:hypothetical protein